MIPLRGVLLGLALTFVGTIAFLVLVLRSISQNAQQAATGIDTMAVLKQWLLFNPLYWLFVLMVLASGVVVVAFRLRPLP
jgi:hypothetical protein